MGVHDNRPEVYLEAPLTTWFVEREESDALTVELEYSAADGGRMEFFFSVFERGRPVLYARMGAQEAIFLSLYLMKTARRAPKFEVGFALADAWRIKVAMRLYDRKGGTNARGAVWVEGGAIWLGLMVDDRSIAAARLCSEQTSALGRLADAMDEVF